LCVGCTDESTERIFTGRIAGGHKRRRVRRGGIEPSPPVAVDLDEKIAHTQSARVSQQSGYALGMFEDALGSLAQHPKTHPERSGGALWSGQRRRRGRRGYGRSTSSDQDQAA